MRARNVIKLKIYATPEKSPLIMFPASRNLFFAQFHKIMVIIT